MSEIIKTEAIVLSKLNYGDTSLIISLFSESHGKLSAIIKGGRNPKSKMGSIADPLNHLEIIFYKKDTREIQFVSNAALISNHTKIKENLEKSSYSLAIIELIKKLTVDNETNVKLFKGVIKIFKLIEDEKEIPGILFGRFFIFFLSELGYELPTENCAICENKLNKARITVSYEQGFLCSDCSNEPNTNFLANAELLNYFFCLKNNISDKNMSLDLVNKANLFLERYTKSHIPDFAGIKSLKLFNNF